MEADAEARHAPRPCNGVNRMRRADHQAGASENALAMRLLDSGVDRFVEPEIVGADDEPAQAQRAGSRSRRSWRKATPPRSRRTKNSVFFMPAYLRPGSAAPWGRDEKCGRARQLSAR